MEDILWVAVTIAFFALSIGYVHFCDRVKWARDEEDKKTMTAESVVMLVVSALTMVYLIYALLRPEKF